VIVLNSITNEKPETKVNCVTQTPKDHDHLIKCVEFSGDNTFILGESIALELNVFHALEHVLNKELVGAGCPAHVLHNSIQHGGDTLSLGIECIIMKL
jgi:hypothetical protein